MFGSRENLTLFVLVTILLVSCDGTPAEHANSHRRSKSKSSCRSTAEDPLKVETQNGWVRGRKIHSNLYEWNGIPYAKPPVGALRFEPPQKPDKWNCTWNATYDRSECIQSNPGNSLSYLKPKGSEDCLYINVYSSKFLIVHIKLQLFSSTHTKFYENRSKDDKVTDFWQKNVDLEPLCGGTFLSGNSSYTLYGPDTLVEKGVIVVSFNYRLGIFGFLSTKDKAAPGNNGLRDQIFALKWVQDNIKAFGGDPKAVTLFGESAGGVSVSYLVLSQRKGLFQKAIMESGTALCLWSVSKTAKQAAINVARSLGITTNDTQQLVSQLKEVDAMKLQKNANLIMMGTILSIGLNGGLVFSPVIEAESEDAVVTGSNFNNLNTGNFQRVPQIIGHNSAEAVMVEELVQLLETVIDMSRLPSSRLVPDSMNARDDQKRQIADLIKAEYNDLDTVGYMEYLSDDWIVRPIQQTVNFTSKYVRTYYYQFSYTTRLDQLGAAHTDELKFIFNSKFNSSTDNFVRDCLTSCWTNFAKTGNPTPPRANICGGTKWRPLTPNDRSHLYYFNINRTVSNGENPRKIYMDFWWGLFNKYGNPPYVTY